MTIKIVVHNPGKNITSLKIQHQTQWGRDAGGHYAQSLTPLNDITIGGDTLKQGISQAYGHEHQWKQTHDSSNHWEYCTVTGCKETRNKAAHSAKSSEVTRNAACTVAGQHKYTCSCGYTWTADDIQALGHIWSDWKTNGSQHWKECTRAHDAETGRANHADPNDDGDCDTCKYKLTRKIYFNGNGGSTPAMIKVQYNGALPYFPTSVRTAWDHLGWFTEISGGTMITASTKFTTDTTVFAHWNPHTYKIVYSLFQGKNNAKNPATYDVTTGTFSIQDPAAPANQKFIGWTGSNGKTPQKSVQIVKGTYGSLHFKANYEPVTTDKHSETNEEENKFDYQQK